MHSKYHLYLLARPFLSRSLAGLAALLLLPLCFLSGAPPQEGHLRIALAQVKRGATMDESVRTAESTLARCAQEQVDLVCFPEAYLTGLRGGANEALTGPLPPPDQPALERALQAIREACSRTGVAAIIGMEWVGPNGLENRSFVISAQGEVLGHQTKNQITPGGEDRNYVPEDRRRMFSIKGVPFGVVICHEGWRYPETVRWAAVRGAKIVFQPQITGNNRPGDFTPRPWGETYYEMAMVLRAKENSIYFASVNEAMRRQNSATSLINPGGRLLGHIPCGEENILIADIDPAQATGLYASRYRPELYKED